MTDAILFPPELRTLSVVPRWSVVWTLTRDTVSNHSFFVTIYTRNIAKVINWKGNFGNLMFRALVHDAEESVIGDLPGPVKHEIIDDQRASDYVYVKMQERLAFVIEDLDQLAEDNEKEDAEAWRIIKAADRLDALIFMITERRLGNGVIAPHLPSAWAKFEAAWHDLPDTGENLDKLWSTYMVPMIKEHEMRGGWGL